MTEGPEILKIHLVQQQIIANGSVSDFDMELCVLRSSSKRFVLCHHLWNENPF